MSPCANPLLIAAGAYVDLGFSVVVADEAKVPLSRLGFPHGVSSATKDLAVVERALLGYPRATLALRVGAHLVLDVDVRHGGPEALSRLLNSFGPLPETWTAETPTGGSHVWFRPLDFKPLGKLCHGVEALTGNRLVTVSPSRRACGQYLWVRSPHAELARAPDWLVRALRPPPVQVAPSSSVASTDRVQRARRWLACADPAVSGQHGYARTFAVCVAITRGFDLDESLAFTLISVWNESCCPPWDERTLKRTIREARQNGRTPIGSKLTSEVRS